LYFLSTSSRASLGTDVFGSSNTPFTYRKALVLALSLTTAINVQSVVTFPVAVKVTFIVPAPALVRL